MPLSIQHQADSAGDKAVSLITDNGGSNVAAAIKGVNKATQNGDTVADLVVSLDGETISANALSGATDDAAATGQIYPLAGLYQATPALVDDGDVGRVRMTQRRGVIDAADYRWILAHGGDLADYGDMSVSTNSVSGYAAPVASDLDIRDTTKRYWRVPMQYWRDATLILYSVSLDATLDIALVGWITGVGLGGTQLTLYSGTLTSGVFKAFTSKALNASADSSWQVVEQLTMPMNYLIFTIQAQTTPTIGGLRWYIDRRS